jgi:TonB family protein
MAEPKGLAIAALVLGIVGLFTAGGLAVGSLVGLALAGVALTRSTQGGRDVAWAAVAANVVALLTILPLGGAAWMYWQSGGFADDALPEVANRRPLEMAFAPAPPPLPPPPPPSRSAPPQLAAARDGLEAPATRPEAEAAPVRVGGTVPEPRKTRHVNPVYPEAARKARVQGVVILECTISPQGRIASLKTLRGVPLLTEAAIEAVRQWEYAPTRLNGVPVPVIVTVTVNFKLG